MNPLTSWALGILAAGGMTAGAITATANAASTPSESSTGLSQQLSTLKAHQKLLDEQIAAAHRLTTTTQGIAPTTVIVPTRAPVLHATGSNAAGSGSSTWSAPPSPVPGTTEVPSPETTTVPPTTTTTAPEGEHDHAPGGGTPGD